MPNDIEVSLFGKGYGECAVIRLPNDKWVIIDSFIYQQKPIATWYLEELNINLANDVQMIVATHWHDDHIRGISQLISQCGNAKLVISSALTKEEFLSLVLANQEFERLTPRLTSGVKEFSTIFQSEKTPTFALQNRELLTDNGICIKTLSPSDFALKESIKCFSSIDLLSDKTVVLKSLTPNYTSVVLWIEIIEANKSFAGLFGADLEKGINSEDGWNIIVRDIKCNQKAQVFKIPHHGSENAYHPEVWENFVKKDALAMISPFVKTKPPLPRTKGINLISQHSKEIYCTSKLKRGSGKQYSLSKVIDKTIKENTGSYRVLDSFGQIKYTYRMDIGEEKIETFGSAYKII